MPEADPSHLRAFVIPLVVFAVLKLAGIMRAAWWVVLASAALAGGASILLSGLHSERERWIGTMLFVTMMIAIAVLVRRLRGRKARLEID